MSSNVTELEISLNKAMETYGDMVYRIAMNQMKSPDDADDIFQEVFIKWMKNREKLTDKNYEKAWLIRVTINQCKTILTSSWNKKNAEFSEELENTLSYTDQVEEGSGLEVVLQQLPEKYRVVLHLFYYEELSIAEISQCLQEKESTIRTQLTRARRQLKKMLEGVEIDV